MPNIDDILDSVKVPALIKDKLIKNGKFENTAKGFEYYSGGFTVVFPVIANGEKWAFRCWHSDLGNVRRRFKIVSDYINDLKSPYFCDFYYCDEGIVVGGKIYPTTRMRWVDGYTLNKYIESHIDDKSALQSLASAFITMIDFLHEKKIAHGDLQHGNIIVHDGALKLVDYDSIFVPGLEGCSDIITGKADFQHPKRSKLRIASEKLDYFSELVIYLSIIAISENPELLNDFSIADSLLFQAHDWENIQQSKIYKALISIDSDDIKLLLKILVNYLDEDDVNNLKPFPELWREMLKKPKINAFTCGLVDGIVYKDTETTIAWIVENAQYVYLNGKDVSGQTLSEVSFAENGDITLLVKNGLHQVSLTKHIKVVNKPIICFSSTKNKLRRNRGVVEPVTLNWSVKDVCSVSMVCDNKILSTSKSVDSFTVAPLKDSTYKIVAVGLDGRTEFTESINIIVKDPAEIDFHSDKMFTLPGVPIVLSWNVKNVKSVKLNDIDVPNNGMSVLTPDADTDYVLWAEDDFGITKEKICIRMLPLPIIQSILVDTPNIKYAAGIKYNSPRFVTATAIPKMETEFIRLDASMIADLKSNGLFVELPTTPQLKLSHRISHFIKNIIKR